MANNTYKNKIVYNGTTLIDLTGITVTPSTLAQGYTALDASGAPIVGTMSGGTDAGDVWQDAQGYVHLDDEAAHAVTHPDPEVSINTSTGLITATHTQSSGLVTGGTTTDTLQLSTQAAATITPTTSQQTAVAANKYTLGAVVVSAMPSGSATTPATSITANPSISVNSSTGLITATTSTSQSVTPTVSAGYVSSGTAGTVTVSGSNTSQLSTQSGTTISPTESEQTAVVAGKYTLGAVKVGAISSTYVGSGIDRNDSADLSASGATVTVPAGYYASNASKSVASGTAGTPTATKGTVSNHSVSVTPSVTNTAGYISGGTVSGTAVTVSASELASGNKEITDNGTNIDVVGYSTVSVNVSGGNITVDSLNVTQNGTYTAQTGHAYSPVTVNVSGGGGSTPWVRPSSWPDLSKMDISGGDIIYMTSYADEARGFCSFSVNCTGSYTVEVGSISGTTFTADTTNTYTSGSTCSLYYGSANGTYKVLRVTGTAITKFQFQVTTEVTIGTFYGFSSNQGIIDIVGKIPSCTSLNFQNQYNLVNVELGELSLSGSANSMFSNCGSLKSLDVSGFNTSSVTSMSQMFQGCSSLTSLDLSGFRTGSVTSMSSMFYNCYSLTSLDVSGFSTGSVTNMNQMFYNCYSLTSLDVSGFDTGSVTNMSNMFANCGSLTSLDVSGFDTDLVTNMATMFSSCRSLTSLDVSGFDFTKVTTAANMGSMFMGCYGLRGSLTLPSTVTVVGASCFANCRSLYEWHFESTTPPSLSNTNAFDNMANFGGKKIYVPYSADHSILEAYKTQTGWKTYASYIIEEQTV